MNFKNRCSIIKVVIIVSIIVVSTLGNSSCTDADEANAEAEGTEAAGKNKTDGNDETPGEQEAETVSCQRAPAKCQRIPANKTETATENETSSLHPGMDIPQRSDSATRTRRPRIDHTSDGSWYSWNYKKNIVFLSYKDILRVLTSSWLAKYPGVRMLLDVYQDRCVEPFRHHNLTKQYQLYPFITIEGVPGSGYTLVAKTVSDRIGGEFLKYPPTCLLPMRPFFDRHKVTLRRAYYYLATYALSHQAKFFQRIKPVITDRYYAMTFAQTVGVEAAKSTLLLPPENDFLYSLPKDLNRPTVSFYVNVSRDLRMKRLHFRTDGSGRVGDLSYVMLSRMKDPIMIPVDGHGFYQEITQKILRHMYHSKFIQIDTGINK